MKCDCDFCRQSVSCCSLFEVLVTPQEVHRIEEILDIIAEFCPWLLVDGGYDNVFDDDEEEVPGLWLIEKGEHGQCPFEYIDLDENRLCGIHSAALLLGEDPFDRKPLVCSLWPLAFSEGKSKVSLGIDSDATQFHCVKKVKKDVLEKETAETIKKFSKIFSKVEDDLIEKKS